MEKKNFQFNQIVILAVALILSVALVVISAVIISNKILSNSDNVNINSTENDLSMQKNIMIATDSQNESYSEVDEDSEEMQGVVRVQDNSVEEVKVSQKTAVEYMSYTAFQLLEEFNNVYTDYGYINGGYTIANNNVCPYFMFSVQADGNTIVITSYSIHYTKLYEIRCIPRGNRTTSENEAFVSANFSWYPL